MLRNKSSRRRPLAEINIVPYIDVMLVLLVIFMVTTPLLTQGVKVNLPQAQAQALSPDQQQPIVVSVDAQGNYYLNIAAQPNQPIAADILSRQISAALQVAQQRPVLVKADKSVNYGQVVNVMVLLQHAGAPTVGLVTEQPDMTAKS